MKQAADFLRELEAYYQANARVLPWRIPEPDGGFDAYKILVSEIMLQQTQVGRVASKYEEFLKLFPTADALAEAPLPAVLAAWSGLGYNRRAKFLWQAAGQLVAHSQPWDFDTLVACPGIGPNTAAAVLAYAYDLPVLFIETNIRTVIIHHFFADRQNIPDKQILQTLAEIRSLEGKLGNREFYWAMMDYGTYLKSTVGNVNRQSRAYAKQSKFQGSRRQIRGQVIRLLLGGPQSLAQVQEQIPDTRLHDVLEGLVQEKLLMFQGKTLMLYNDTQQSISKGNIRKD